MTKKEKYELLKNQMHTDYIGKYGILINRNGATIIVDVNTITDEELNRLLK